MYYVYILKSEKAQAFYTGLSQNVSKRLKDHNAGRVRSTRPDRPWVIVYKEKVGSRTEARKREKYLKSGIGREQRKIVLPM